MFAVGNLWDRAPGRESAHSPSDPSPLLTGHLTTGDYPLPQFSIRERLQSLICPAFPH